MKSESERLSKSLKCEKRCRQPNFFILDFNVTGSFKMQINKCSIVFSPKHLKKTFENKNKTNQHKLINRPTHILSYLFEFLPFCLTFQVLEVFQEKYMKTNRDAFSICFVFVSVFSFTIKFSKHICVWLFKNVYFTTPEPMFAFPCTR